MRRKEEGRADDRRHRRGPDGDRAGNRRAPGWSRTPKIAAVYHAPLRWAPPDWSHCLHPRLGLPAVVCASVSPSHLRTLKTLHRSTLYAPLDHPSHKPQANAYISCFPRRSPQNALLFAAVSLRVSALCSRDWLPAGLLTIPLLVCFVVCPPSVQSSMVSRRHRHVAQVPQPPLQPRPQHRCRRPLGRPTNRHHPDRADIGLQTECTRLDSQGEFQQSDCQRW